MGPAASGRPRRRLRWQAALGTAVAAASGDVCECLNWKQTYEAGLVRCGEGVEYYWASRKAELTAWQRLDYSSVHRETCHNALAQMDTNYCVNLVFDQPSLSWDGGTWCYVSADCLDLNGGQRVVSRGYLWTSARDVSWKVCRPGLDRSLRDLAPPELFALPAPWGVHAEGFQLNHYAKLAYQRGPGLWWHHESHFHRGDVAGMPRELQKAVYSASGLVFFSEDSGVHALVVVHGREIWSVHWNPAACPTHSFCAKKEGELRLPAAAENGGGQPETPSSAEAGDAVENGSTDEPSAPGDVGKGGTRGNPDEL